MLLLLAGVRCIYTISEQPSSSLMPRYDYIKYVKTILYTVLGCPWLEVPLPEPEIYRKRCTWITWIKTWCKHMQAKIGPSWAHPPRSQVTWELTDISAWNPPSAGEQRLNLRWWVDVSGLGQVPLQVFVEVWSYLIYRSNLFRASLLLTISSLYSRWIHEEKMDHQSIPKQLIIMHIDMGREGYPSTDWEQIWSFIFSWLPACLLRIWGQQLKRKVSKAKREALRKSGKGMVKLSTSSSGKKQV